MKALSPVESLLPFARLANTNFEDTMYEFGDDDTVVLVIHEGTKDEVKVTLGHFRQALDTVAAYEKTFYDRLSWSPQ